MPQSHLRSFKKYAGAWVPPPVNGIRRCFLKIRSGHLYFFFFLSSQVILMCISRQDSLGVVLVNWHCHGCGSGAIPGPGTSTCCERNQKFFLVKKKNKTSPTANPPFHVSKLRLGESSYFSKLTEHSWASACTVWGHGALNLDRLSEAKHCQQLCCVHMGRFLSRGGRIMSCRKRQRGKF